MLQSLNYLSGPLLHSLRCGLTSAEQRGRPAMLCLMQPRIPLSFFVARAHCWLVFNFSVQQDPSVLSAKLLSSWSDPSMCWHVIIPFIAPFKQIHGLSHPGLPLSHRCCGGGENTTCNLTLQIALTRLENQFLCSVRAPKPLLHESRQSCGDRQRAELPGTGSL